VRIYQSYWLVGDFNVNVKDNSNAEFMKDTLDLEELSDISQGTTIYNSCIDMVFG
jgi:hypothetical protein